MTEMRRLPRMPVGTRTFHPADRNWPGWHRRRAIFFGLSQRRSGQPCQSLAMLGLSPLQIPRLWSVATKLLLGNGEKKLQFLQHVGRRAQSREAVNKFFAQG